MQPFGCGSALPLVAMPGQNRVGWFFSIHDNGRGQFWYDNGFGPGGDDTRWMPRYMGGSVAVLQSVLDPPSIEATGSGEMLARPLIRPFVPAKQTAIEGKQKEGQADKEATKSDAANTQTNKRTDERRESTESAKGTANEKQKHEHGAA